MSKNYLRFAVMLFATTLLVGAVFAATNGVLVFGGTVRINNAIVAEEVMLEFANLSYVSWDESVLRATGSIADTNNVRNQRLQFDIEIRDIARFSSQVQTPVLEFEIRNTGNVPVRFLGMSDDWFTSAHAFAVVYLRNNTDQVWITQSLNMNDAGRLGVIQPGQAIQGRIRVAENVVAYHTAINETSFGFSAEVRYERAQ